MITADSKNTTAASVTDDGASFNNCLRIATAPSAYIFSYAFNTGANSLYSDNALMSAPSAYTLAAYASNAALYSEVTPGAYCSNAAITSSTDLAFANWSRTA